MALFATVVPWYAFEVVLPLGHVIHILAVITTLWGFTTLAPILIIVGAFLALILAVLLTGPLSDTSGPFVALGGGLLLVLGPLADLLTSPAGMTSTRVSGLWSSGSSVPPTHAAG